MKRQTWSDQSPRRTQQAPSTHRRLIQHRDRSTAAPPPVPPCWPYRDHLPLSCRMPTESGRPRSSPPQSLSGLSLRHVPVRRACLDVCQLAEVSNCIAPKRGLTDGVSEDNQHWEAPMLLEGAICERDQRRLMNVVQVRIEGLRGSHRRSPEGTDNNLRPDLVGKAPDLAYQVAPLPSIVPPINYPGDEVFDRV